MTNIACEEAVFAPQSKARPQRAPPYTVPLDAVFRIAIIVLRKREVKDAPTAAAARSQRIGDTMGGNVASPGRVGMALAALFMLAHFTIAAGETGEKSKIIATLFPQYDFARRIAGDRAEVSLLLKPGTESHSFEPTPTDMKNIAAAAFFIYTGPYMEPWAKRMADSISRPDGVTIVDASAGITPRTDSEHGDHDHDHDSDNGGAGEAHFHEFDPHIWLDPVLAAVMIDNIAAALSASDPEGKTVYADNAELLKKEIAALDASFREKVAASPRRTLVFGERFAFGYFFDRYGLEEVGAYKSCAPGAEPGMRAVLDTVKYVKDNGIRYIYLEAMATSRITNVIHQETGAAILEVDSLHNPPADRQAAGVGYVDIMRENMDAFALGLK